MSWVKQGDVEGEPGAFILLLQMATRWCILDLDKQEMMSSFDVTKAHYSRARDCRVLSGSFIWHALSFWLHCPQSPAMWCGVESYFWKTSFQVVFSSSLKAPGTHLILSWQALSVQGGKLFSLPLTPNQRNWKLLCSWQNDLSLHALLYRCDTTYETSHTWLSDPAANRNTHSCNHLHISF